MEARLANGRVGGEGDSKAWEGEGEGEGEDVRARRSQARVRAAGGRRHRQGELGEQHLRCLSPHKSPLFRPAASRPTAGRARNSGVSSRPRTSPAPVLQSTFFFASLVRRQGKGSGDDSDDDDNNDVPLSFKNLSKAGPAGDNQGRAGEKPARTAPGKERVGALTETRLGDGGGAPHHHPHPHPHPHADVRNGRRSISEMATPDI